jgi:Zn-dependent protease
MLKFSLPGVPVSVHWSFLIVAFFGLNRFDTGLEIAGWTLAVFGAVLLHESGHAYSAKAYGSTDVSVTLFALGGYTTWLPKPTLTPGKRFVISAAGSAVGIVAGLLILWANSVGVFEGFPSWALAFFDTFVLVGLFWGVLNWIPLLPLDGGHMLNHALAVFWPKQAPNITLGVSTVVGVGLIGAAFYYQQTFMAIFLIFILFSGWRQRPMLAAPEAAEPPTVDPHRSVSPNPAVGPYPPADPTPPVRPYPPADPTPTEEPDPPAFPI